MEPQRPPTASSTCSTSCRTSPSRRPSRCGRRPGPGPSSPRSSSPLSPSASGPTSATAAPPPGAAPPSPSSTPSRPPLEAGDPAALARLQTLLRRVALVTSPRADGGAADRRRLDRAFSPDTGGDFGPLAADLADAPYRPASAYDGRAALAAARRWIRRHHA